MTNLLAPRPAPAAPLVVAACLVATAACELPVDPGSDMADAAPSARLGPEIDTGADVTAEADADISGRFDLTATVTSDLSDQETELPAVALAEQTGEIGDEQAAVSLELRPASAPETPGASTDEPAPIDASGAFQATITGYTIPADSSPMLQADTDADVALDAQILDADCFVGETTITMYDVEAGGTTVPELVLEGPFEAARQGASCDDDSPPTSDAATSSDAADPLDAGD